MGERDCRARIGAGRAFARLGIGAAWGLLWVQRFRLLLMASDVDTATATVHRVTNGAQITIRYPPGHPNRFIADISYSPTMADQFI